MSAALAARRRTARLLLAALIAVASLAAPTSAQAISLGFTDFDLQRYAGTWGSPADEAALNAGFANARRGGAQEWRVFVTWDQIARGSSAAPQPATLAADPAWAGYRWDDVDRLIKGVTANGMRPMLTVLRAPPWAEGKDRPKEYDKRAPYGTWKPDPAAFEQFARALARRYDGSYPDPADPARPLPRVINFQGWNEPNLYEYLTPQWEQVGGRWQATSVTHFRKLARAFSRGVRAIQPSAKIILAGSAPFGGLERSDPRIPPARFYRDLLCVRVVRGVAKGRRSCPKLDIDGWAHHTYPIGPPWRTARNADDVVVPDMGKLTRIANAAARAGTVRRAAARDVWVTEMSWESSPDPSGLSPTTHAFYMQGAFYTLWRAGVKHILWFGSRDMPRGDDWNITHQSGIFFRGADPSVDVAKPSFTAFRFPFAAFRARGVARLWAKPPAAGTVIVEARTSSGWKQVATLKRSGDVATARLRVGLGVQLRARVGNETSLTWTTL